MDRKIVAVTEEVCVCGLTDVISVECWVTRILSTTHRNVKEGKVTDGLNV